MPANDGDETEAAAAAVELRKALKIDTSTTTVSYDDRKSPSVTAAQDSHPYARGAVIEVWHIPKTSEGNDDDDWWSDESSSESDDNEREKAKKQSGEANQEGHRSVRLCDIIDRVPHGHNSWRYYVHYRDFNRRMDEWINVSRIVSPPSVGNAKARALKREEEKNRKRKQQWEQQEAAAAAAAAGIRSRRRSTSALPPPPPPPPHLDSSRSETITPDGRRTRLSRRKSFLLDDDATVVASNEGTTTAASTEDDLLNTSTGSASSIFEVPIAPSEVLVADAAVTTTVVGEHTVATVQAVELDEHEGLDEASLREHEEVTKIKNVGFLELGQYQMETWYFSPLPKELINGSKDNIIVANNSNSAAAPGFLEVLYVCEFTFRMFARKCELQRFQRTISPQDRHPPGNEIYRNAGLAMFEVDGLEEKIYCQNLCYIAKLFLDHKTLYFDVDPFLFYVLCEVDDRGFHPVGYYSKEKYSDVGYNLACILSFPSYQRKGYGRFLIAFSYELTKKEEKVGSPEKPMSDLGQQAYKPYWASTIIDFLLHQSDESALSIMDISKRTSIMAEDIVYTLNQLGILKIINGVYFVAAERSLLTALAQKYPVKEPRVDPTKLHWTPFLTDIKRDKFSIHSKKPSLEAEGASASVATNISGSLHSDTAFNNESSMSM